MLNGIDPILIFEFSKTFLTAEQKNSISKIPIVASVYNSIGLPPIPIYLSETLTGLYIDTEDRNIEIDTSVETLQDSEASPIITQKGINSTVKISMIASKNSIGLTLLSALADLVFPKVSSKAYSITYLHGAVTVFRGLMHSFSINQNASNELFNIQLEIQKAFSIKPKGVEVDNKADTANLNTGANTLPPQAPSAAASPTSGTGISGPPPQAPAPAPVSIGGRP